MAATWQRASLSVASVGETQGPRGDNSVGAEMEESIPATDNPSQQDGSEEDDEDRKEREAMLAEAVRAHTPSSCLHPVTTSLSTVSPRVQPMCYATVVVSVSALDAWMW
jgi:hypothetical protein